MSSLLPVDCVSVMLVIVLLFSVAALAQQDPAPVVCKGECGDAAACLNSGRRLVSDVCATEGQACCVAPTPCNVATPSGFFFVSGVFFFCSAKIFVVFFSRVVLTAGLRGAQATSLGLAREPTFG